MTELFVAAALLWALAHVTPSRAAPRRGPRRAGFRPRFRSRRAAPEEGLIEFTTEVATRLRSGASPGDAWAETAVRAHLDPALDDDGVPVVLHAPGHEDVRAAWVMATELGAPLADILDECALAFTHAEENASARAIALAGPRASARLLASLPAVGVVLGSLLGADPMSHLLSGGIGTVFAVAGLGLYATGLRWSGRLMKAAVRAGGDGETPVDPTVTLALVRAALRGGASIPRALEAAGRAVGSERLRRAGRLLLLGAAWEEAWTDALPGSIEALVARVVEPAWVDGANPIPLLERAAAAWNARRDRRAREAAERLGVRLIVPLGACYLPAFVLVGVFPVLLATGGDVVFA